jgi:hypothetical protein
MAQKYTLSDYGFGGNGFEASGSAQLSDGTLVTVVANRATNTFELYYSVDKTTLTQITTFGAGYAFSSSICVDASDNIYIVYVTNLTTPPESYLLALSKGTGYTWTVGTALRITGGTGSYPAIYGASLSWCNTGGGTGGKGHLALFWFGPYSSTAGTYVNGYYSLDAGAALAGSFSVSSTYTFSSGSSSAGYGVAAMGVTNGFGGITTNAGFYWDFSSGTSQLFQWSLNSSGVFSFSLEANPPNANFEMARVGSNIYAVVYPSGGVLYAAIFNGSSLTAFVATPSPLNWPSANNFAVYVDATTSNRLWCIVAAPGSGGNIPIWALSCDFGSGTPVWATAATAIDTVTYTGTLSYAYPYGSTVINPKSGASPDFQLIVNNGTSYVYGDSISLFTAPAAPTLSAPANASYLDATASIIFGPNTYNSTDGTAQSAYAFRIKVSGGSYQYWNAGTNSLQSTIVWNADSVAAGGTWSVTLPAGLLSDGNVYNWSMASQESGADLQGAFASDFTFTAQAPPAVSVTYPSGTTYGTTEPAVVWNNTIPSGATQTTYQVIVEEGGFSTSPGSGIQVWASGVVSSSSTSAAIATPLGSNVSYRVFVQIAESGGQTSAWGYSTFILQVDSPAAPVLTALPGFDPTTGSPLVTLTLLGQDNQLTLNQASLESNVTTGWSAGPNTTIATSSTWAQDGSYSLALTATAAGAVSAATPTGTSGVACSPGQVVRAMGFFHSPTTARACTVAITFYNSAGSVISTLTSTSVNSTLTGNGGQAFITGTAPALTASMSLTINGASLATSELLYADCMFLGPGSSATWTTGGFVGGTVANFTFSDDGVNWFAVRNGTGLAIPTTSQTVSVADYEGSLGFTRQYKAQVVY